MLKPGAKRFYKVAEARAREDGFGVELDGRAVRTPAGAPLTLPGAGLAEAIAAEWTAQEGDLKPAAMPMMQLACTAIDRVIPNRAEIVEQTAAYGGSDLLCYRAEGPDELIRLQAENWQPVLDWAAEALSAPLVPASGVMHVAQPGESLVSLMSAVAALDDWRLTGVAHLTQVFGSLVLALAVEKGRLEHEEAFAASVLDEAFQAERWGEDREALLGRKAHADEARFAAAFLTMV
jgi:chaperone required for assembly of F1-ATPase